MRRDTDFTEQRGRFVTLHHQAVTSKGQLEERGTLWSLLFRIVYRVNVGRLKNLT